MEIFLSSFLGDKPRLIGRQVSQVPNVDCAVQRAIKNTLSTTSIGVENVAPSADRATG